MTTHLRPERSHTTVFPSMREAGVTAASLSPPWNTDEVRYRVEVIISTSLLPMSFRLGVLGNKISLYFGAPLVRRTLLNGWSLVGKTNWETGYGWGPRGVQEAEWKGWMAEERAGEGLRNGV